TNGSEVNSLAGFVPIGTPRVQPSARTMFTAATHKKIQMEARASRTQEPLQVNSTTCLFFIIVRAKMPSHPYRHITALGFVIGSLKGRPQGTIERRFSEQ